MVIEAAEKKIISNQATAGIYYFSNGREFIQNIRQMIDRGITTNNEYYVCPVFNEYIKDKKKIRAFPVKKMWSFSTPEDLHEYLQHHHNQREYTPINHETLISQVSAPLIQPIVPISRER